MICMTLLVLGMAISLSGLKRGGTSEQSRSLAQVLSDQFRQARDSAISRGIPVGLGFQPAGLVQSLYRLEGEKSPRVVGGYRWDREFPQAAAYLGKWPLNAPWTWKAPAEVAASRGLDLESWAPSHKNDALFVYLPSGRLVSNQPSFGGAQHLVTGLGFGGGAMLTGVDRPFTLTLWPDGETALSGGLSGSSLGPASGLPGLLAVSPWQRPADPAPEITSVEPCPPPVPETLPPGIDASVSPEGYLTFTAYANDYQGEPLACLWRTETSGSFSAQEESRMEWDAGLNSWVSRWTFTPPPSANVNDVYTLHCRVSDPGGQAAESTFGVAGRVLVTRRQKVAYLSDQLTGDIERLHLYTCNTDGTERRQVTKQARLVIAPKWSMDGSRIIYLTSNAAWPAEYFRLRSVNPDGSDDRLLYDPGLTYPRGLVSAVYSFDGRRVLVLANRGSSFDLVSVAEDGSEVQVINPTSGPPLPAVKPNYNGLQMDPKTGNLLICDENGTYSYVDADARTSFPVTQPQKFPVVEHCFSPDGQWIYFSVELTKMYRASFQFDGGQVTIGTAEELPAFGIAQTPSAGLVSDTIFYQRQVSPTVRRLARYSISQNKAVDLTDNNYFEDDCCVTNFPDTVLP